MFPAAFQNRMQKQLESEYALFESMFTKTTPTSIRVNTKKNIDPLAFEKIPWALNGYYLDKRPVFVFDPLWHGGAYYVQEASSMLLEQVFNQLEFSNKNIKVLDLCAAPGGKSTHLLSLINESSLMVANEVIASRNSLMRENIIRWGFPNVVVTQNDPKDFEKLAGFFDLILIDAPCSGEGLFRKEPDAMQQWSEENASICVSRQQRIIADVLPALKQDGYIIYSTCTYNPEENEQQLAWMLQKFDLQVVQIKTEDSWGVVKDKNDGLHCMPHKVKGEGFFIAAIQKKSAEKNLVQHYKSKLNIIANKERKSIDTLLQNPEYFQWIDYKDVLHFFPKHLIQDFNLLLQNLHIKMFGTMAAEMKQKDIIPHHNLALSITLNKKAFEIVNLEQEVALQYLRKDTLEIIAAQHGWNLMQYKNTALGFIKVNEHRINNYYPTEWRLRKQGNK